MPSVPLTPPMIDLCLVLLQMNRDLLDRYIAERFSPGKATSWKGRVPEAGDMAMMRERDLTLETIKVLEAAK